MPVVQTQPLTEADLRQLPRWARVAFAARCGRRVQPLLRRFWDQPHPQLLEVFERVIEVVEQSAAQAKPCAELEEAMRAAESCASAVAGFGKGSYSGPSFRVPVKDKVRFTPFLVKKIAPDPLG